MRINRPFAEWLNPERADKPQALMPAGRQISFDDGMAVLLTTHVLSEAESCDRVGIIDDGRLVALDTPAALKRIHTGDGGASLDDVFFHITGRALRDTGAPARPTLIRRRA